MHMSIIFINVIAKKKREREKKRIILDFLNNIFENLLFKVSII